MELYGIAAMTPSRLIGRADGKIPWHIKEDMQLFKQITMGHILLMGRKTWESIGKSLPGRRIYILTKDPTYTVEVPNVTVFTDLNEVIHNVGEKEHLIVCGGGEIYTMLLPFMTHIHVSTIYTPVSVVSGDVLFPEFTDQFPEYLMKKRYSNFEYGIFMRHKGQKVETPDLKYPFTPPSNLQFKPVTPPDLVPSVSTEMY